MFIITRFFDNGKAEAFLFDRELPSYEELPGYDQYCEEIQEISDWLEENVDANPMEYVGMSDMLANGETINMTPYI
jgi:hypothetical protein